METKSQVLNKVQSILDYEKVIDWFPLWFLEEYMESWHLAPTLIEHHVFSRTNILFKYHYKYKNMMMIQTIAHNYMQTLYTKDGETITKGTTPRAYVLAMDKMADKYWTINPTRIQQLAADKENINKILEEIAVNKQVKLQ